MNVLHLLSVAAALLPMALAGITFKIKSDGHDNVPVVQEPAADPARVEAEMRNLEGLAVAAIQRNTAAANQQHQGFEGDLKTVNQRLAALEDVVNKDLKEQMSHQELTIF